MTEEELVTVRVCVPVMEDDIVAELEEVTVRVPVPVLVMDGVVAAVSDCVKEGVVVTEGEFDHVYVVVLVMVG